MTRVICVHGLGGSGATMRPVADALAANGNDVFAPTLTGHGTTPDDLVRVRWQQWLADVADWPADIAVGQSMGASLALALATRHLCSAVVLINPLGHDPDAIEGLEWRQSRGHEWIEFGPNNVDEVSYDRVPIEAAMAMHKLAASINLCEVTAPSLIITSRHDDVVDPCWSGAIAGEVSGPVARLMLERSGHVATLDVERKIVCTAVVDFVARFG